MNAITINNDKMVMANSDTTRDVLFFHSIKKLEFFASMMPEGKFLNLHNDEIDHCSAIVIRLGGEICPVFKNTQCCMNPLNVKDVLKVDIATADCKPAKEVRLSTFSISGRNFVPDHSNGSENWLKTTIDNYNKQVIIDYRQTRMNSYLDAYIVAAYEF